MMHKAIVGLLALLLLGEGLVPLAHAAGDERGASARVVANSLNIRGGPGTEHAVVRSLPRDTIVTIVAAQGEWSQVRLEDGTTGWAATKYLEAVSGEAGPEGSREASGAAGRGGEDARAAGDHSGASGASSARAGDASRGRLSLGSIAKWGCLAGAAIAGGLAYSSYAGGNDAYDGYKKLYQAGEYEASEVKYNDALDQDDQAQVFLIAAGALAGLFLLQQFVLGGGGDEGDQTRAGLKFAPFAAPPASETGLGGVRLALVRLRF